VAGGTLLHTGEERIEFSAHNSAAEPMSAHKQSLTDKQIDTVLWATQASGLSASTLGRKTIASTVSRSPFLDNQPRCALVLAVREGVVGREVEQPSPEVCSITIYQLE